MQIHEVPRDYRTWVRHEGCGFTGATAWRCYACAIQSIPVGASRIVSDRLSHASSVVCRISAQIFCTANVNLDRYGNVTRQFGVGTALRIASLPSFHIGPTCHHIDITGEPEADRFGRTPDSAPIDLGRTFASIDRYLKEARQA